MRHRDFGFPWNSLQFWRRILNFKLCKLKLKFWCLLPKVLKIPVHGFCSWHCKLSLLICIQRIFITKWFSLKKPSTVKFLPNYQIRSQGTEITWDYLRGSFIMRRLVEWIYVLNQSKFNLIPKICCQTFKFLLFSLKLRVVKKSPISSINSSFWKTQEKIVVKLKLCWELNGHLVHTIKEDMKQRAILISRNYMLIHPYTNQ